MNMYFILYLILIQNVQTDAVFTREEIFEFTEYNPDKISINVTSEIQGNLEVRWGNTSAFNVYLQISTQDTQSQNPLKIVTNFTLENLHLHILKKIVDTTVSPPSSLNTNRAVTTVGSFFFTLWIIILTHGWKVALLYMVLVFPMILLVDANFIQSTRCDIIVECPRNITLHNIELYMENGNITVDQDILQSTKTTANCKTSSNNAYSEKGCESCCHGNGVCGPGNECTCFRGLQGNCSTDTSVPKYRLFVNPGDSRITEMRLPNGENVTVHGRKRHDGTIRSLDTFRSRDNKMNIFTVFLNGKRKIKSILSQKGESITFDWKDKCNVHVTAITSKGQGQVNIEVDTCASLNDLFPLQEDWNFYQSELLAGINKCFHSNRQIRSTTEHVKKPLGKPSAKKSKYFVPVKITRCGSPVQAANVYAHVKSKSNSEESGISELMAKSTKTSGLFHVQIPTYSVKNDKSLVQTSCDSFNTTVERTCRKILTKFSCDKVKFCLSIRKAFSFVKSVSSTQIDDVIQTCEKAFDTVISVCTTITSALKSQNIEPCTNKLQLIDDSYIPGPILFSPFAVFPNGYVVDYDYLEINPSPNKKYHKEIILRDPRPNPTITSFSITPEDPKPLQRYEVKVYYSCASKATEVDMQIVGSDKYTNYATCYGITSCNCCVLHVAGAAASVKDIVTVTVTDPLVNVKFTREFVVIF